MTDGVADAAAIAAHFVFLCKLAMRFFFRFCAFVFAAMTFYLVLFAPYNEALTFL